MSEKYNVLKEPWIKTVTFSGNHESYGILEILKKAPEIKEISYANPLEEFSVYRFLSVFLMDALRPQTIDDIQDILEDRKFNENAIDDYVSQCISEGVSFDLFDEKKPFMQAAPDEQYEKEPRSVNYLDYSIPTGNNPVHFNHLDNDETIQYADVLPKIIACELFATAGVQGFPSSINGAPPYFSVIIGNSLFESLCYMLVPIEEMSLPFDNPKVYWRNEKPIVPKEQVNRTSWLYGMLYPARRIRCVAEENKAGISLVYFGQGSNFVVQENWTDPEVTYRMNDNGRFPWRPDTAKAVWRNLSDLIDIKGKRAPAILHVFQRIHGTSKYARIKLFGVQTNQASYLNLAEYDFQIPERVIDCQENIVLIREFIGDTEGTALNIKHSLSGKNMPSGLAEVMTGAAENCVRNFYVQSETLLWNLCDTYFGEANIDADQCRKYWKKEISRYAREQINAELNRIRLPGKYLIKLYQNQMPLLKYLRNLEKEGEE